MPIKVFGSTSGSLENKFVTSSFVQKPKLRTKFIETVFEEDVDPKKQLGIKNYQTQLPLVKQLQRVTLMIF